MAYFSKKFPTLRQCNYRRPYRVQHPCHLRFGANQTIYRVLRAIEKRPKAESLFVQHFIGSLVVAAIPMHTGMKRNGHNKKNTLRT